MKLSHNEDQSFILEQLQSFCDHALTNPKVTLEEKLILLEEQGLASICLSEKHGGSGLDPITLNHSLALLASVSPSLALFACFHNCIGIDLLQHYQITDARLSLPWLSFAQGVIANFEEDHWVLQGQTSWLPFHKKTSAILLLAKTAPQESVVFWLEPQDLQKEPISQPLGMRDAGICTLQFSQTTLSKEALICQGKDITPWIQRRKRVGLAALSLGIASAALTTSISYANARKQFGKPISSFQAIQWKIADMAMAISGTQLLLERASFSCQEKDEKGLELWGCAARQKASKVATQTCQEAIQIHGGYGFTTEFPVEQMYRDAHVLRSCWQEESHIISQLAPAPLQRR